MELSAELAEMLEAFTFPAFAVHDGMITYVNRSAQQRQISCNIPVTELISIGAEDYANFSQGKLCLTLRVCNCLIHSSVVSFNHAHIFLLESDYEMPELQALSVASEQLREPLSVAMNGMSLLSASKQIAADENTAKQLEQVNRSLQQILRSVCNMSDAVYYSCNQNIHMQQADIVWIFDEILQKAEQYATLADRRFVYNIPNISIEGMVDSDKLERAVLNLISNAIKYSATKSEIHTELVADKKRVRFTIENDYTKSKHVLGNDFFSKYLREPGMSIPNGGIGLGLSIVRSVAAMHQGTVLMQETEHGTIRVTLSFPVKKPEQNSILRSQSILIADYAGCHDRALLELSDSLPAHLYKS